MNNESQHRRILIIDDNQAIHEDFRKIFSSNSNGENALSESEAALFGEPSTLKTADEFQIDYAFQGQQGLALVQKALAENNPYALAFVDVRMPPGWDGIETSARIWELDPDIQIVICTAFSDYTWEEMVADPCKREQLLILKKPFDMLEVLQLGHALTEKWRLLHALKSKISRLELNADAQNRVLMVENAKLHAEIKSLIDTSLERDIRGQHLAGKN